MNKLLFVFLFTTNVVMGVQVVVHDDNENVIYGRVYTEGNTADGKIPSSSKYTVFSAKYGHAVCEVNGRVTCILYVVETSGHKIEPARERFIVQMNKQPFDRDEVYEAFVDWIVDTNYNRIRIDINTNHYKKYTMTVFYNDGRQISKIG